MPAQHAWSWLPHRGDRMVVPESSPHAERSARAASAPNVFSVPSIVTSHGPCRSEPAIHPSRFCITTLVSIALAFDTPFLFGHLARRERVAGPALDVRAVHHHRKAEPGARAHLRPPPRGHRRARGARPADPPRRAPAAAVHRREAG